MFRKYRYIYTVVFLILILLSSSVVCAQDLKQLREERKKQLNEINYTEKLLSETSSSKKNELSRVKLLNKQISNRKSVIRNIRQELKYLERTIDSKEDTVKILRKDVDRLKEEYSRMICKAYQTRKSYDKAQYILAASDFNQAYKRMKYLQQYSRFRKQQAKEIRTKKSELEKQLITLQNARALQSRLLNQSKTEIANLNNERQDKDRYVKQLSKKEGQLRAELRKKRRIYNQIEDEIRRIMAEAIGENVDGNTFAMTPEMKIISNEFGKNKGKLPWPVERGVITSKYGRHKHEVLKNVIIENNGVDIATSPGQAVRAIFEGQVNSIMSFKGANLTVVIQHGEYFTVYHGLVNVRVRKGDIVQRLEIIGNAFGGADDKRSQIQFQLWKGTDSVNPEIWLAR